MNPSGDSNVGKRSLAGFSTAAKSKMYDPLLSSSDCADASQAPQSTKGYANGCPYTSYTPYWNYYCSTSGSPCNSNGGYADTIITAALSTTASGLAGATGLTNGAIDFTGAADSARKEVAQKASAYMSAWMYAIREFEDAIDDCTAGSLTANGGSSGPVHAWDEGVAFYVGSAMSVDDLYGSATGSTISALDTKGFLAYTLANKRCKNFRTCGYNVSRDIFDPPASRLPARLPAAASELVSGGRALEYG